MNWTKFNIGLSVITIVVMGFFVLAPAHAGWDHGPQAPVGGPGYGEGASQENDIHGDDYSPDHMDGGGDSVDNYEEDWNTLW